MMNIIITPRELGQNRIQLDVGLEIAVGFHYANCLENSLSACESCAASRLSTLRRYCDFSFNRTADCFYSDPPRNAALC